LTIHFSLKFSHIDEADTVSLSNLQVSQFCLLKFVLLLTYLNVNWRLVNELHFPFLFDHILVAGEYSTESGANSVGTGRNRVQMKLGRGDLGAKYECRAMNDALETAMLAWINVDVHGKPKIIHFLHVYAISLHFA